jgi:mutator protein MutT
MKDVRRTLLLLRRDNEVLLAMKKRGFGAGLWNGVGGKLDQGETVEHAMIRECQEEIGVTPTKYYKVAEHDFHGGSTQEAWNMYVHVYIATEWQGEPHETEEMSPKWYALSDIPYKNMWQDDPYWMPLVFEGKSLKGNFVFDANDTLISHEIIEVDPYE